MKKKGTIKSQVYAIVSTRKKVITTSEVAERTGANKSTVASILSKLARAGLIQHVDVGRWRGIVAAPTPPKKPAVETITRQEAAEILAGINPVLEKLRELGPALARLRAVAEA